MLALNSSYVFVVVAESEISASKGEAERKEAGFQPLKFPKKKAWQGTIKDLQTIDQPILHTAANLLSLLSPLSKFTLLSFFLTPHTPTIS